MNQAAIDQIKAERDAAVRERDAMAQEIERLRKALAWAMGRIEPHQASEGDKVLYEFCSAFAALKETK